MVPAITSGLMTHKAGFVNIVGNPNVGKSTLMNQLVGERISIATFKAQTTRHRIMGIVNTPDMQIVFSDILVQLDSSDMVLIKLLSTFQNPQLTLSSQYLLQTLELLVHYF